LVRLGSWEFASAGDSLRLPRRFGGGLEGLEGRVDMQAFDPVRWTLERPDSAPLRLTFQAKTSDAGAWARWRLITGSEQRGGAPLYTF